MGLQPSFPDNGLSAWAVWRSGFPNTVTILQVFRGVITREAWMEYYAGFTAVETDRFITYLDPSADFSKVDLASGPELKRVVAAKLREFFGG